LYCESTEHKITRRVVKRLQSRKTRLVNVLKKLKLKTYRLQDLEGCFSIVKYDNLLHKLHKQN